MKKLFAILFSMTAFFALSAATKLYTMQGTTIKIKDDVTTLPRWCLSDETNAERIVLPASVKTIERGALLKYCTISCATQAQKNFCLENGYAVEGTYSIKNSVLTINDGVKIISPAIARGNTSITKIILPNGVKEIDPFAFSDMTNLREINLPESLETIGASAFFNCKNLDIKKIPDSVKYIGPRALMETATKTELTLGKKTVYETTLGLTSFNVKKINQETEPEPVIEATKYCMDITGWDKKSFTTEWTSYEWSFPSNAFTKGSNTITFTYTSGGKKLCLKDVIISADEKVIFTDNAEKSAGAKPKSAEYTFTLSTVPSTITLRAKARTDGGTNSNGNITVNGAKTKNNPQRDKISGGVLTIGEGQLATNEAQYMQNTSFTEIVFPSSLKKISGATFQLNTRLKKVTIPGSVKEIGEWAFARCRVLEDIVLEEGVEVLGEYAFWDCPKLKSVTVPKSLRVIKDESSLFWGNNNINIFHCYAGSETYQLATKYGFRVDILGIDEQNADKITELLYSANTVVTPVNVECKNLTYIGVGKAETISDGAFQKCPVELIDLSDSIKSIGKNAFNSVSKIRMPRGSYAETWAKQNGYYLCETLADLSTYTKNKNLAINESNFTRILCNSDTVDDITKYHFNVTHPLTLDIVNNRLELTSYMLYPCKNVTVKKVDSKGKETVVAKFDKIQPLARYVVVNKLSGDDAKLTYTVTADDDFYKSLNELPVSWDISFSDVRTTGAPDYKLPLKAPHCREWISLMTQMAYIMGSRAFEGYFLTSKNYFYTGLWEGETNKTLLTDAEVRKTYRNVIDYSMVLGILDGTKSNTEGLATRGTFDGSMVWLKEPYFGQQYRAENWFAVNSHSLLLNNNMMHNWYEVIAHEMMHNMGYEHDSNFCGHKINDTISEVTFQENFTYIARQLKQLGLLPYDDEHILATSLYWFYDYYYINK